MAPGGVVPLGEYPASYLPPLITATHKSAVSKVTQFVKPKDDLNIDGPPPVPLLGNVQEMMADPLEKFQEYRKRYGGIFKYYYFASPVVVVSDPKLVQCVLHTHSKKYYKEQDPIIMDVIGNGLLLSNGTTPPLSDFSSAPRFNQIGHSYCD